MKLKRNIIFIALASAFAVVLISFAFGGRDARYIVDEVTLYSNGDVVATESLTLDDSGNAQRISVTMNGTTSTYTCQHDRFGNPTSVSGSGPTPLEAITFDNALNDYGDLQMSICTVETTTGTSSFACSYQYDDEGQVRAITYEEPAGTVLNTTWFDKNGWCTRVDTADGQSIDISLTYASGRVTEATTSTGTVYTFAYDGDENLSSVSRNGELWATYDYTRVRKPSQFAATHSDLHILSESTGLRRPDLLGLQIAAS